MSTTSARAIVQDVLGPGMTREIWTSNYEKVLPISIQDFDIPAILPAVFYMFRFGHRRGKGGFVDAFSDDAGTSRQRKSSITIDRVAGALATTEEFVGFQEEPTRAILGDLLLGFSLENRRRALGRHEQVQRVAPAHYMASWIDLPDFVAHLRYVPEMIVAMLADQSGPFVQQNSEEDRTWFAVGRDFEDNTLLRAFHQGMIRSGQLSDRAADRFQEEVEVGLDQLLMIRLAQQLGAAPDKLRGGDGEQISNQQPIAEKATRQFSEDIRNFVRGYAHVIPRHAFVELLESCMAIGLTAIVTSVVELLFEWAETGAIRSKNDQRPTYLLIDSSNGVDSLLRGLAEQSMDDLIRRIERFPVILMALRLLDYGARFDPSLRKLEIQKWPYATDWLNLLGALLFERRVEAEAIFYDFERKAIELSERLSEEYPEIAETLANDTIQPNPVWRLAEALTSLQGRNNTQAKLLKLIDSVLMTGSPNGLGMKRAVIRKVAVDIGRKKRDVRSLVFTDTVLDYLVHRHLLRTGNKNGHRRLSFEEFLYVLQDRYGFCIDQAPPGMVISNELLRRNRLVLERRVRDLGLMVGVNDAESMKQLKPRFRRTEEDGNGVD